MKINCLIIDDEPLERTLIRSLANRVDDIFIVAECNNVFDAMSVLMKHKIDLIFLDIRMPEADGLQFLRTLADPPAVIFTTAYREFGADAFDLNAIDYLVKPIAFDRFLMALNKCTGRFVAAPAIPTMDTGCFFVTSNRKKVRVQINEVMFVESLNDHVNIHLQGHVIQTRDTISKISGFLPTKEFVRIHRSFIVAAARITQVTSEGINVANRSLPFGRSYKIQARAALGLR